MERRHEKTKKMALLFFFSIFLLILDFSFRTCLLHTELKLVQQMYYMNKRIATSGFFKFRVLCIQKNYDCAIEQSLLYHNLVQELFEFGSSIPIPQEI